MSDSIRISLAWEDAQTQPLWNLNYTLYSKKKSLYRCEYLRFYGWQIDEIYYSKYNLELKYRFSETFVLPHKKYVSGHCV